MDFLKEKIRERKKQQKIEKIKEIIIIFLVTILLFIILDNFEKVQISKTNHPAVVMLKQYISDLKEGKIENIDNYYADNYFTDGEVQLYKMMEDIYKYLATNSSYRIKEFNINSNNEVILLLKIDMIDININELNMEYFNYIKENNNSNLSYEENMVWFNKYIEGKDREEKWFNIIIKDNKNGWKIVNITETYYRHII